MLAAIFIGKTSINSKLLSLKVLTIRYKGFCKKEDGNISVDELLLLFLATERKQLQH